MYMSDPLPYTGITRIPRLIGVKNYLNNYLAIQTCLPYSHIHVYFGSLAYLVLRIIIQITFLPCMHYS